ncbi:MAG TPA: hypothetical protein VGE52_17965, partial [Pirellulales bacterium]
MPRKMELTWQAHAKCSGGRWRKKYRGHVYYFDGTTKTDIEGYKAALAQWVQKRAEIDSQVAQSPLQVEYAAAIKEWDDVIAWSVQHGDESILSLARGKLAELQQRAAQKAPATLTHWDRFQTYARREPPETTLDAIAAVASKPVELPQLGDAKALAAFFGPAPVPAKITPNLNELDASPGRIAGEIWRDRLEVQNRRTTPAGETVAEQVKAFLDQKRQDVALGKLTPGRFDPLRVHFEAFRDWFGPATSVKSISVTTVEDFFTHVSQIVVEGKISAVYGADRFAAFRRFVRWLYQREAIESTPRNLDDRRFRMAKQLRAPEKFEIAEVNALL